MIQGCSTQKISLKARNANITLPKYLYVCHSALAKNSDSVIPEAFTIFIGLDNRSETDCPTRCCWSEFINA
jgi:hypothetical protein